MSTHGNDVAGRRNAEISDDLDRALHRHSDSACQEHLCWAEDCVELHAEPESEAA